MNIGSILPILWMRQSFDADKSEQKKASPFLNTLPPERPNKQHNEDMITREQYEEAKAIVNKYHAETRERSIMAFDKAIRESEIISGANFQVSEVIRSSYADSVEIRILVQLI